MAHRVENLKSQNIRGLERRKNKQTKPLKQNCHLVHVLIHIISKSDYKYIFFLFWLIKHKDNKRQPGERGRRKWKEKNRRDSHRTWPKKEREGGKERDPPPLDLPYPVSYQRSDHPQWKSILGNIQVRPGGWRMKVQFSVNECPGV